MTTSKSRNAGLSRRTLLHASVALGAAAPFGAFLPGILAESQAQTGPLRPVKLAWNATAVCTSPIELGRTQQIFAKHGIELELINFGSSTEALLEAIATGKADAGVGMALRWLKPMEQGFDVKITAGTHGGCMRLLALKDSGIARVEDLRGKTVAVSDMASPNKNFFSIMLAKRGIDPESEVNWRVFPPEMLDLAVEKGEADAATEGDPRAFMWIDQGRFVEVATNLSDEFADRVCCILGVSGTLVREEQATAAALTRAALESQLSAHEHPDQAAQVFSQYAPGSTSVDLLQRIIQSQTHSPVGYDLRQEIALYAEELKLINVFRPSTDPQAFADAVFADVLSA